MPIRNQREAVVDSDGLLPVTTNTPTGMEGGGKIEVGTTAIEATFTATPTRSIIISADSDNTGVLYVGESDVTNLGANAFCFLQPGEAVTFDYNDVSSAVFVVSDTAAQNFFKGALYD